MIFPPDFPPDYVLALTDSRIRRHFPNLTNESLQIKSRQTDDYNCVAWAVGIDDDWIQFKDEYGNLDVNLSTYIKYFQALGFSITEDRAFVNGIHRIAIYYVSGEFKHVSFQLADGIWASKMGDWEDIHHQTLESLVGPSYGTELTIMQKKEI